MSRKRKTKVPSRFSHLIPPVIKVNNVDLPGSHFVVQDGFFSERKHGSDTWRLVVDRGYEPFTEVPLEFEYPDEPLPEVTLNYNVYDKYALLSVRKRHLEKLLSQKLFDHKVRSGRGYHLPAGVLAIDPHDWRAGSFLRVASEASSAQDAARTMAAFHAVRSF